MSAFRDVSPAWTYDVPIRSQELLSSWLCRSAHRHGFPAYRFLSWRLDGVPVLNRDFDLTASGEVLAEIDRIARLPAGSASSASLSPFLEVVAPVGSSRPRFAHVPFLLSAGVFHRTRVLHGLQACPACLGDGDPYFPRWGRLAFVTVCPTHRCGLIDACPSCDAPIVPSRAPVRGLATCHVCLRPLCSRSGGRGPFAPVSPRAASDFQDLALAACAAPSDRVAGMPCCGADFLRVARVLTSVCGPPSAYVGTCGQVEGGRRQVERMRVADRRRLLARVMEWLRDWPDRFRERAAESGLTMRTFFRHPLPEFLAAEVARLPAGGTRARGAWRSIFDDEFLQDLRRTDSGLYRATRAQRLLAAAGR